MINWNSVASFATAGGTLVLAVATFASIRSANQAARTAERALLVNLRPVLVPSRPQDAPLKSPGTTSTGRASPAATPRWR